MNDEFRSLNDGSVNVVLYPLSSGFYPIPYSPFRFESLLLMLALFTTNLFGP